MKANLYTVSAILTALVTPALYGCMVEDTQVQTYTFE